MTAQAIGHVIGHVTVPKTGPEREKKRRNKAIQERNDRINIDEWTKKTDASSIKVDPTLKSIKERMIQKGLEEKAAKEKVHPIVAKSDDAVIHEPAVENQVGRFNDSADRRPVAIQLGHSNKAAHVQPDAHQRPRSQESDSDGRKNALETEQEVGGPRRLRAAQGRRPTEPIWTSDHDGVATASDPDDQRSGAPAATTDDIRLRLRRRRIHGGSGADGQRHQQRLDGRSGAHAAPGTAAAAPRATNTSPPKWTSTTRPRRPPTPPATSLRRPR